MNEKHLNLQRARRQYYKDHFGLINSAINEGGSATFAEGASRFSSLTAGVIEKEIGALGYTGLLMTDGNLIAGSIVLPYDLNPRYPVGFRIGYTIDHDGSGNADASWIILADAKKAGQAIVAATTALNTVIPVPTAYVDENGLVTSTTDYRIQRTGRGIKNSLGLSRVDVDNGAELLVEIEMDAATNETAIIFRYLEIDYAVQLCVGHGQDLDQPTSSRIM